MKAILRLWDIFRDSLDWRYLLKTLSLIVILLLALFLLKFGLMAVERNDIRSILPAWHSSVINMLGFGWLLSFACLGGSPVAAIVVGLQSTGVITAYESLFGIMGSRMGAVSLVFLVGLLALLHGKKLKRSFGIGVVTFIVTVIMSVAALLLASGMLVLFKDSIEVTSCFQPPVLMQFIEFPVNTVGNALGPLLSIFFAVSLIILSMELLEKGFRMRDLKKGEGVLIRPLFDNPRYSFLLGFVLTAVFFSISVTIAILVPLYLGNRIHRKTAIPYIIGANISTFSDTLLVALSFGQSELVRVVGFAVLGSVIIGAALMMLIEKFSERTIALSDYLLENPVRLAVAALLMVLVPLVLVVV